MCTNTYTHTHSHTCTSSPQSNHKSWMNDSWEQLHGESVESAVTGASKVSVCVCKLCMHTECTNR